MSASAYFSTSYAEARARFREACDAAGLAVESRINPVLGPDGEELATEVARVGPAEAERVLLTISATHGIEGYCGSGVQVGWLESGLYRELPPGLALVMIHAINPYGFAWSRRVTEDNVDLNRNFPDFDQPLPRNPGYEALHKDICPETWDEPTLRLSAEAVEAYREAHGSHGLQAAVSAGQYSHPDGLFYGGSGPTWSHRTLIDLTRRQLAGARQIGVIDYHTGLGPYGHGERICVHPPGSAGEARAAAWYGGDITSPAAGTSSSPVLNGTNSAGVMRALPDATFTWVALEYGTQSLDEVLASLRADNWLHLHGDPASPLGREITAEIRRCFYPDADDWKQMIWDRAVESQRLALNGLAEG